MTELQQSQVQTPEPQQEHAKDEHGELDDDERVYRDPLTTYEYLDDCRGDDDEFCRNFIRAYLTPIRNRQEAVRHGLLCRTPEDLATRHQKPRPAGSGKRSKHAMVYVRRSCLAHSAEVTAHGKYDIRGLTLEWDLAVWAALRAIPTMPDPQHFRWNNAGAFRRLVHRARYLPEISRAAKRMALAVATGQYVVCSLLDYKSFGTRTNYLRQLCTLTEELYMRLDGTMCLFLDPEEREVIARCLPQFLCRGLAVRYRSHRAAVFFNATFGARAETALKRLYSAFCECGDWRDPDVPVEAAEAVAAASQHAHMLPPPHFHLENAELRLENNRHLGAFHLPAIRHLTVDDISRIRASVSRDLGFAEWSQTLVDDYFLLPTGWACANPRRGYVMYLASNAVLALRIIRLLHASIRHEQTACVRMLSGDVQRLIRLFKGEAAMLRKGLAQNPVQRRELSRFRKHVHDLKRVRFTVDGFVESFCDFLDVIHRIPDYRCISLRIKRELLCLHTFKLRRVYRPPPSSLLAGSHHNNSVVLPPPTTTNASSPAPSSPHPDPQLLLRAERLAWHYLRHGDVPQDRSRLPQFSSALSDAELSNNANRCRRKAPVEFAGFAGGPSVRYRAHIQRFDRLYVRRFRPHEVGGHAT
ncbi:protein UL27 [Panine betaherpesvirus 2]|uniref:Protein UL27 n=1 Tax=Panine betaherpesvirus 2 TaxID=188763 RepID=Q8QS61_9BETA|nr:protein UL27 [Panine betaherpesvirus 2]AAM00678.1 protein UL27 [Panine betaherpesvirus 2]QXV67779.1 protein UL27 [Panine betaherpesvirus 2]